MTPFQQKRIDRQRQASDKATEAKRLEDELLRRNKEEEKEKLKRLDKIVEDSSEKNRNYFAAYLSLLIYVQAIVFSTTDLQLLYSVEGLKMPIVDITVPLVGFYAVVPFFIIALHFNFLQNLESHHNKLMRWQEAYPNGKVPRTSIQPFLFDYAVLETEGQMVSLVSKANSLLCLNFAPITLGLLLIRYSDSQDWPVTLFHYFAFVFDAWLVWKLRLALKDNAKPQPATPTVPTVWGFIRDIRHEWLRGVFGLVVFTVTLETVMIGGTSDKFFVTHVQPVVQTLTQTSTKLENWLPPHGHWLNNGFFNTYIQPLWQPAIKIFVRPIEWFLPRIAIDPTKVIWRPDEKALQAEAKLAHSKKWVEYFERQGKGFQPSTHSLRFARLPWQNLRKAQLKKLQLQGVDLTYANLQGANLGWAELQGAQLSGAELQGAQLIGAQLQGAELGLANLQGANLAAAQLQGADLGWAQLQGAYLGNAQLQGAILREAHLQGADFEWAELQGVDLELAELQGALFESTNTVGLHSPSKASIFNVASLVYESSTLIDKRKMESNGWERLVKLADEIPDEKLRMVYQERITQAKDDSYSNAEKVWKADNSQTLVQETLTGLCRLKTDQLSRLRATKGFRINFTKQSSVWFNLLQDNPEYQNLLKTLDTALCTLPACKDLRDGIEGLDCATATK